MSGDVRLGAVLRELRTARDLTLEAVARQAGCVPSTVSNVERGLRQIQPWLAEKLDQIYGTGSMVLTLARGNGGQPWQSPQDSPASGINDSDIFVVQLPKGGVAMPLSRREVLTALGLGIATSGFHGEFDKVLDGIRIDGDTLPALEEAYVGYKEAARIMQPAQLIDGMTGDVAILDGLRRRATGADQHRCSTLQSRYAESLSWLSQEAGDPSGAMYWVDRALQWAQAADWSGMTAWNFVQRTTIVHIFSGDGSRIVDQARPVLDMPHASPRMKGIAAGQMAYGHALVGNRDESRHSLDKAMEWLARPVQEDDILIGQRGVISDDIFALYQTTCDIYLGYGARAIPVLEPRLDSLAGESAHMATVTRAKVTRAYANAGQPAEACRMAWETLDGIDQVGSHFARNELHRTVPVLQQWHGRSDVQDVLHRLSA